MSKSNVKQTTLFRGIYEFEDPSGTLLVSKQPQFGSADLYDGTAVAVRPNQCALIIYKGQITEVLKSGLHYINSENVPILTKLANWKFGFNSPLRTEIWFFAGNQFNSSRWGTASPTLVPFENYGSVPIRSYGHYSVGIKDPRRLLLKLVGTRPNFDLTEVENYIQGQIQELLPNSLTLVKDLRFISIKQAEVAAHLNKQLNQRLDTVGLIVRNLQVLSLLPTKEVIEALDTKVAMDVVGNSRDFLLFKAAKSLGAGQSAHGTNDPMQMMMGLVLGNKLMGTTESNAVEHQPIISTKNDRCKHCNQPISSNYKFCAHCGKELKS